MGRITEPTFIDVVSSDEYPVQISALEKPGKAMAVMWRAVASWAVASAVTKKGVMDIGIGQEKTSEETEWRNGYLLLELLQSVSSTI